MIDAALLTWQYAVNQTGQALALHGPALVCTTRGSAWVSAGLRFQRPSNPEGVPVV